MMLIIAISSRMACLQFQIFCNIGGVGLIMMGIVGFKIRELFCRHDLHVFVSGGIRRDRYVYLPYYLRFMALAREISPSLFDRAVLYFAYGD